MDNEYYINEIYLWLLAICCAFCSILISFKFLILSCSITIALHLRFNYCENFKLAWKEAIDKIKWNLFLCVEKILSIS